MLIYYIVDMDHSALTKKTLTIEDGDTSDVVYRKVASAVYGNGNTPIAIQQLMTSGDVNGVPQRHIDYVLPNGAHLLPLLTETNIEPTATLSSEIFQEGDVINVVRRSSLIRGPDGTGALRGGARNRRRRRRSSRRKSKSKSSRRKSSRRKSSRRKSSRRKSSRRR